MGKQNRDKQELLTAGEARVCQPAPSQRQSHAWPRATTTGARDGGAGVSRGPVTSVIAWGMSGAVGWAALWVPVRKAAELKRGNPTS